MIDDFVKCLICDRLTDINVSQKMLQVVQPIVCYFNRVFIFYVQLFDPVFRCRINKKYNAKYICTACMWFAFITYLLCTNMQIKLLTKTKKNKDYLNSVSVLATRFYFTSNEVAFLYVSIRLQIIFFALKCLPSVGFRFQFRMKI